MKLYLVTANRGNKVETVLSVSPNLTHTMYSVLNFLRDLGEYTLAKSVLADFSNEVLTDNCAIELKDGLVLQMSNYELRSGAPEIGVGKTIEVYCESGDIVPCKVLTLVDRAGNIVVQATDEAEFVSVVRWTSWDNGETYSWKECPLIAPAL